MALPIKVRVHPFVLFGIVDAHEHRPKTLASKQNKEPERRAVGTLFGALKVFVSHLRSHHMQQVRSTATATL